MHLPALYRTTLYRIPASRRNSNCSAAQKNLWTKKSFSNIDSKIPFLVLTGDKDPINEKGKQAEEISNLLIDCGFKSEFMSYKGMRHEPLTEINRDMVMKKIGSFFASNS